MIGIGNLLASLLGGPIVREVMAVIERAQQRKLSEAALRAELEQAVARSIEAVATTELQARRDVLIAELRGESALQRLLRPIVALSFAFVMIFYALLLPIAVDWLGMPPVRIGDTLLGWIMTSVNIAIGGYIGGRTLEKVLRRR